MKHKVIIPLVLLALVGGLRAQDSQRGNKPERPTPPTAAEILEKFDANGDGTLELSELEVMVETARERRQAMREEIRERLENRWEEKRGGRPPVNSDEVLEKFDSDNSGSLEQTEIDMMMETVRERRGAMRAKFMEQREIREGAGTQE